MKEMAKKLMALNAKLMDAAEMMCDDDTSYKLWQAAAAIETAIELLSNVEDGELK